MSQAPHLPPPVSFEITPARRTEDAPEVERAASALAAAAPSFISVRTGAAGVCQERSLALLRHVRDTAGARPVGHITGGGLARAELTERIEAHLAAGVRDFLAVRGDAPRAVRARPGIETPAAIRLLRRIAAAQGLEVTVGVAAHPHGKAGVTDSHGDVAALLAKQAAGAAFALTQVVFDAASYACYVARARRAGVTIPVIPGIMPIASPARLRRITALTGVQAPVAQVLELENEQDPRRWEEIAVARAVRLGRDLLDAGAPALHVYSLNRPETALAVAAGLRGETDAAIREAAIRDPRAALVA
ncbi:hypothetical protein ASD19_08955 [Microbacterium sp. Root53]|uniref:methylenetetrahydrofolate reductase n=1 Tax=Microbacterium sp. Root53 TaxID=1736553 RepID=UPI0006F41901|nr:methylenetetrahydrofolate reductase [Microbacterium sp. Root53]KQY97048.1 hypothetical protein ASD19_08955 [Microbacterium sp. Root53]